jgi:hypothetical protein
MKYPMSGDKILGDGGNTTVYERPDGSQYALDPYGRGCELPQGTAIIGKAKFDSRPRSDGHWTGSRSAEGDARGAMDERKGGDATDDGLLTHTARVLPRKRLPNPANSGSAHPCPVDTPHSI